MGYERDSRLGPNMDEDSSIWTKPYCMTRPFDKPSISDPLSEIAPAAPQQGSPQQRAQLEDGRDKGKAAGLLLLGGLLAGGLV